MSYCSLCPYSQFWIHVPMVSPRNDLEGVEAEVSGSVYMYMYMYVCCSNTVYVLMNTRAM